METRLHQYVGIGNQRALLAIASEHDLDVFQLDAKTAGLLTESTSITGLCEDGTRETILRQGVWRTVRNEAEVSHI